MKKCNDIQDKLIEYLQENTSSKETKLIDEHISSCTECENELFEMKQFLGILSDEKEDLPSINLKLNFDKALEEAKQSETKVISINKKNDWKTYLQVAAMIAVVFSAFLIGKHQESINSLKIANKNTEQETELLVLLENESASKRILAVNKTENYTNTNTKVIQALINRLFFDKNANVRLAAAEALSNFTSEEAVKVALIKALETEKKPSIQIELIQILAKIKEKRAVKPMQKMLANKETPSYVKQQLSMNLSSLL